MKARLGWERAQRDFRRTFSNTNRRLHGLSLSLCVPLPLPLSLAITTGTAQRWLAHRPVKLPFLLTGPTPRRRLSAPQPLAGADSHAKPHKKQPALQHQISRAAKSQDSSLRDRQIGGQVNDTSKNNACCARTHTTHFVCPKTMLTPPARSRQRSAYSRPPPPRPLQT